MTVLGMDLDRFNVSIKDRKAILVIALVNTLVFFTIWVMELQFGFRPTERVGWFFYGNDAHSYLDPIESLISNGTYAMPSGPTAFRMPGFLPFYGPFYALFGKTIGLHIFSIINLFFTIGTGVLIYKLAKRHVWFIGALLLAVGFALFPRLTSYGYLGASETIAAFSLTAAVYYIVKWFDQPKSITAFKVSIFLTMLLMLKPIAILLFIILGIIVLIRSVTTKAGLKSLMVVCFYFFIVPSVCISAWTARNYIAFDKFIPLTPTLSSKGADQAFRSFCRRTGLQFQSWQGSDARVWFLHERHKMYDADYANSNPFPDYLFTSKFNYDTLVDLRSDWHRQMSEKNEVESSRLDAQIESRFWTYSQSFIDEHPFHFLVTIRFVFLKDFILIRDSFSPFKQNTLFFKALRAHYFLTYYAIVLAFLLGIISLYFKRNRSAYFIVVTAVVFVLLHVAMGRIENRYLMPATPLFVLGLALFVDSISNRFQLKKED